MIIYYVRHGQTDSIDGKPNDHDNPLNTTGTKQAKDIAEQLKDVHFDAIISSNKQRALQTAHAINTHHQLPIVQDSRWREREIYTPITMEEWEAAFNFDNSPSRSVEPLEDLFDRVHAALDDLQKQYAGKTILVTAHGGVHHAMYAYANKIPRRGNVRISRLGNCDYRIYKI